jgi:hypothetical protein
MSVSSAFAAQSCSAVPRSGDRAANWVLAAPAALPRRIGHAEVGLDQPSGRVDGNQQRVQFRAGRNQVPAPRPPVLRLCAREFA